MSRPWLSKALDHTLEVNNSPKHMLNSKHILKPLNCTPVFRWIKPLKGLSCSAYKGFRALGKVEFLLPLLALSKIPREDTSFNVLCVVQDIAAPRINWVICFPDILNKDDSTHYSCWVILSGVKGTMVFLIDGKEKWKGLKTAEISRSPHTHVRVTMRYRDIHQLLGKQWWLTSDGSALTTVVLLQNELLHKSWEHSSVYHMLHCVTVSLERKTNIICVIICVSETK